MRRSDVGRECESIGISRCPSVRLSVSPLDVIVQYHS